MSYQHMISVCDDIRSLYGLPINSLVAGVPHIRRPVSEPVPATHTTKRMLISAFGRQKRRWLSSHFQRNGQGSEDGPCRCYRQDRLHGLLGWGVVRSRLAKAFEAGRGRT